MGVEITVRHTHAMEDMHEYAKGRAQAILDEFRGVEHVHVILDVERHIHIANVVAQAKHHPRVESRETSDNMRASIDKAVDNVESQLRKLHDRVRDHKVVMKHSEEERNR